MIRTLVCGHGEWGRVLRYRVSEHAEYDLVGIVDASEEKRVEARELGCVVRENLIDAIDETHPDLVVVATPIKAAPLASITALTLGASVLAAKPAAVATSTAELMISAADQSSTRLIVDYTMTMHPKWRLVKEARHSLGEVRYVDCVRTTPTTRSAADPLIDLAVHDLALIVDLEGRREWRVRRSQTTSSDSASVVLDDADVRACVLAERTDARQERIIRVVFDRGHATWDQLADTLIVASNRRSTEFHGPSAREKDAVTRRLDETSRILAARANDNRRAFLAVTRLLEEAKHADA